MQKVYDLIIVGGMHPSLHQDKRLLITLSKGGTSGCLVASRLANTAAKSSVLLLEAGGDNKHLLPQDPDRYRPVVTHPEIQHAYFTTPQEAFGGKEMPYSRGRGLGGSSLINFMGDYCQDLQAEHIDMRVN